MTAQHSSIDIYNQQRIDNVFPRDWKNPQPQEIYDLVVVGGGPGGLTAAIIAAGFPAKVAIIEKEHLGGECFNVGCIPSKALLRSSRCAAQVRDAALFGVEVPKGWKVNFYAVMERVRKLQSILAPFDSAPYLKNLGIDVFLGTGRFIDASSIEVANNKLQFKKAIIATGTYPIIPNTPGLKEAGYLTNENIFNLTSLPSRLAVIGGGPLGCEFAQAFLRFGSEVILINRGSSLLSRDDALAAERLQKVFESEGMKILFQSVVGRVEKKGKEKILHFNSGNSLAVDDILVATGRAPNVGELELEKAKIAFDVKEGIIANDTLETSNPNIYVIGDVSSKYKFTHVSVKHAEMAVQNALKGGSQKKSELIIPWCTYTAPEVAHIGLGEKEALLKGIKLKTSIVELKDTDRAILDGETVGFVKIHRHADTDQILGATIMATHAGDMISELAVAMTGQTALASIAKAIHPFPTQAAAIHNDAIALLTAS
jgi:pyruvate/2-oxoglutarate dehydrogenase complex dihydrolipoamide dehydrogenase (E3) component